MDNLRIKTETDKLIEVMTRLLELPKTDQKEVSLQVKAHGFTEFFQKFESFDLSDETKRKLADLYNVLQTVDDEVIAGEGREAEDE